MDNHARMLKLLQAASHDVVFVVEHDVMYAKGYFDEGALVEDRFCYNTHVHTLTRHGYIVHREPRRIVTSQLLCRKDLLEAHYRRAIDWINRGKRILWCEPGRVWHDGAMPFPAVAPLAEYRAPSPSIDVRWGGNLTGDRRSREYITDSATWGNHQKLRKELGI
jgi:hypothetical protein